eukprot:1651446-Pleurochrysis_carterae.AAC.1
MQSRFYSVAGSARISRTCSGRQTWRPRCLAAAISSAHPAKSSNHDPKDAVSSAKHIAFTAALRLKNARSERKCLRWC